MPSARARRPTTSRTQPSRAPTTADAEPPVDRAAADARPGRRRPPQPDRTGTQRRARRSARRRTTRRDVAMPKMKTHSGCQEALPGHRLRQDHARAAPASATTSSTSPRTRTRRLDRRGRARRRRRQEDQEAARPLSPRPAAIGCPRRARITDEELLHMARVKRAVNAQKKRRVDPRAGQRLPRPALAAVPQGEGAGAPLARLRLPRPHEAQGRLPPAVDPAHQRRGPRRTA